MYAHRLVTIASITFANPGAASVFHQRNARPIHLDLGGGTTVGLTKAETIQGKPTLVTYYVYNEELRPGVRVAGGTGYARTVVVGSTGFVVFFSAPIGSCCTYLHEEAERIEESFFGSLH